jgi:acetyl-CoA acetyltransferase
MITWACALNPGHRVEGGGATGGICFQEAWKSIASGHMDICVAYGFETMSHVETWKGNEFIALASDVSFDYPVGGFLLRILRHDGHAPYEGIWNNR